MLDCTVEVIGSTKIHPHCPGFVLSCLLVIVFELWDLDIKSLCFPTVKHSNRVCICLALGLLRVTFFHLYIVLMHGNYGITSHELIAEYYVDDFCIICRIPKS